MKIKEKYQKKFVNHIISTCEKIDVISGTCRFNYMCHMNAVHDAINNKDTTIAMCVYIEDGFPIIHFINIHEGKYIDNTLGNWSSRSDYYLVKIIKEDEFWNVQSIFNSYRLEIEENRPLWFRLFFTLRF